MFNVEELLAKLNIDKNKQENILKKEQLKRNLELLYTNYDIDNKLLYTLACTAPKKIDLLLIGKLIFENTITNESTLRAILKLVSKNEKMNFLEIKNFIKKNTKSKEEVKNLIKNTCKSGLTRKEVLIKLKNDLPFEDSKEVMDEVNKFAFDESTKQKKSKDWLEEGEISLLHKPGENPQINEKIMKEHLERTFGKVVTRFPPEPNGILHIGHAKAINLDFGYAEKYNGICYLRFDDTNPRNEEDFYFDSILEDVKWLGFTPYQITSSSKYFEKMIEFAEKLILKNKAYICDLSNEEVKRRRRLLSESFENDSKKNIEELSLILSPHRNRPISENLKIFKEMIDKKYKEGDYTLRFKMNLSSKNPLMFDLVGMRIIDSDHVVTKDKYNLYPSYEFALCVSDSLEDVTHSFCTREFFTRQESYNWLLDELELYKPVQWEFSRLNISNTVLSKRKIVPLEKYGIKLDDPRLYTIKGMRRRGIPAQAINNFVRSLGLTYSETIIDNKMFESFIRDELNRTSRRVMCVTDPIKVNIRNITEKKIKTNDEKNSEIIFKPFIYIEKSDFKMEADSDFLRFTPSQPVGLHLVGNIKFVKFENEMIIAEMTEEKCQKYIHWVPCDSKKVELRIYDQLFKSYNPEEENYLENLNLDSKKVIHGYCDSRIEGCQIEDKFQFQRIGYFCVDPDSTSDNIVLNKTISLK
ncbi:glutamine-tRNA ligase (QARS1) [Vairimorpha necatrix]|uniref:glutamine--tRNA ligase n=1 Tax=Vairimorpha necatrix TaxID=6039 RepID=A0AAX4JDK5_9MICR